jgi:tRNA (guanine37-N1)-methyltransferase
MHFDIISILPELIESPFNHSIIKRAKDKNLVSINFHQLRDFSKGKNKQVDDYPFSGSGGMVLMPEPIFKAINFLKSLKTYDEIIYTSPDGEKFNQKIANELSLKNNILILCGHYKGIDHRIREHMITREISIGDYVVTGGEIAAIVMVDSIVRLLPGVINDETSALSDSFQDDLLAPPVYTRPYEFNGWKVPDILLSGNEKEIEKWKHEMSIERTRKLRPDIL